MNTHYATYNVPTKEKPFNFTRPTMYYVFRGIVDVFLAAWFFMWGLSLWHEDNHSVPTVSYWVSVIIMIALSWVCTGAIYAVVGAQKSFVATQKKG